MHGIDLDEDEDEDIDQLIEDLESQDGDNADYEEEEVQQPGGARLIPDRHSHWSDNSRGSHAEEKVRREQDERC